MNMPELWPHQLSQASGRRVSFHTPVLLVVGTVLQSFIQIKLKDPGMFVSINCSLFLVTSGIPSDLVTSSSWKEQCQTNAFRAQTLDLKSINLAEL